MYFRILQHKLKIQFARPILKTFKRKVNVTSSNMETFAIVLCVNQDIQIKHLVVSGIHFEIVMRFVSLTL
jgi:hypothetical protein